MYSRGRAFFMVETGMQLEKESIGERAG